MTVDTISAENAQQKIMQAMVAGVHNRKYDTSNSAYET